MIVNFKRASIFFVIAYLLVTVLATASSITYSIVEQTPEVAPGDSILHDPAFVATVPFHVLIMLIIWPIFAGIYFRKPRGIASPRQETLQLGIVWTVQAIVVDLVFFVLLRHPYSLTFYEFYVIYQPWILMIYAAIFISPFIRLFMVSMNK